MKKLKLLLFILLPIAGFSQIGGEDEVYLNGDRIRAKFNGGGFEEFAKFLDMNFDYSKVKKPGKLEAAFTVDTEGKVTKIRITQVLDIESATEFIRVLKMCPKWEPAKRGGKPISIEIKYPMVFNEKLNERPATNKTVGTPTNDSNLNADDKVYQMTGVEVGPAFEGGLNKFYEFIAQNYNTPDVEGLKGKVVVSFIVDTDGKLKNIMVIKDIGHGTGKEAIRVLKLCPKWNPATQNGVPVRCEYSFPIAISSKL